MYFFNTFTLNIFFGLTLYIIRATILQIGI